MPSPGQIRMREEIKGAAYEPQSPDEHIRGASLLLPLQDRGGFVFLLAYAQKENADAERLLQTLMDQTRRLADSFGKESNPQHRFEQFLGALNEVLASHVREGHWHIPIEQVHALVGIASSSDMYLSGTGELVALFLHKKPSQRYQVFNLFRGLQTEQSLPTWEKTFAVVLDGDLHPGDVFCLSDKELQRTIPPDELHHILASLPPVAAVERIRQYFSHADGMLLTVLKIPDQSAVASATTRIAAPTSNVSVEELNATEDLTDRLLDDQRPSLRAMLKRLLAAMRSKTDQRSRLLRELQSHGRVKDGIKRLGRILWRVLLFAVKHGFILARRTHRVFNDRDERTRIKKHLALKQRRLHARVRTLTQTVRAVPKSTAYLACGIVLALIVLGIGLAAISKSQARAQEEEEYQTQLTAIEDTMERAAGAAIYKDENQARSLYQTAQTLVQALAKNTPEREAAADQLENDLQAALNDIRHLITIPNPPLLADLETLTDGVFGNALLQSADDLFVAGSDGRIYRLNRGEKRFDVAAIPADTSLSPIAASQEDGRLYVLQSDGTVSGVSPEEASVSSASVRDDRWVDLEAYANRLYLLRPTTPDAPGQIVRFNRNGSAFDTESEWITSRTASFDQAVSLAVDGNVYVLMHSGTIVRFAGGSEEGWDADTVDPRITSATKIWTDASSAYVYVLEPSTQRLIVFAKESGAFVAQYRSEAFQGLTDFAVDEAGYTIYLVAGSKLYSIAPSHL